MPLSNCAGYLLYTGSTTYGLVLLGLIAPQIFFQVSEDFHVNPC